MGQYGQPMPPVLLVLLAAGSVQFGSGLAKTVFDDAGPGGTVLLRVAFAAIVLVALWRPRVAGLSRRELGLAAAFGGALGAMNLAFYESIDRIPLGVAVTFEFIGPLGVAVAASRRARDGLWVALAALGILLLSDFGDFSSLDAAGVGLALLAGCFWAAYILLSARVGQVFPGGAGLALAMVAATVLLLPVGIADGGAALLEPEVLALGAAVAMLSSAIPYSLELEALRKLPAGVFGVLMSLDPAVAALAGYVVLGEILGARELAAIGLVVVASAGAARSAPAPVEIPK
jgi:inner membrane transporter RhtA